MKHLYAPWRQEYLEDKSEVCPFCECAQNIKSEVELGIIFRAKFCFGVMNRYPYAPGHFMVIPYAHVENITDLNEEIWLEMSRFVRLGVGILKQEFKAQGVNIGMNLGQAAGAGIGAHCHYHLLPRYVGDTNFITSVANLRICGKDLNKLREKLKLAFEKAIKK